MSTKAVTPNLYSILSCATSKDVSHSSSLHTGPQECCNILPPAAAHSCFFPALLPTSLNAVPALRHNYQVWLDLAQQSGASLFLVRAVGWSCPCCFCSKARNGFKSPNLYRSQT